jgi:predicted transcriptional regulator
VINRSRTDIVENILKVAETGAIKTKIMYGAFLSYPQLKAYLELLIDSGLLKYSEGLYHTTENGKRFLKIYKEMRQTISSKEDKVIAR